MSQKRTELQKEVVEALVSSQAINFEAVAKVFATYGSRAAINGDSFGALVHWRCFDICIPPDPWGRRAAEIENLAGGERG
jgi:hypothetical protein